MSQIEIKIYVKEFIVIQFAPLNQRLLDAIYGFTLPLEGFHDHRNSICTFSYLHHRTVVPSPGFTIRCGSVFTIKSDQEVTKGSG